MIVHGSPCYENNAICLHVLCHNTCMFVLHFGSPEIKLETAGGKGLNLARLARAGFNVPRGFIISTEAYRVFVDANRWLTVIGSTVESIPAEDAGALEKTSAQIRAAFSVGVMPPEIVSAIHAACDEFRDVPVAVRSSATAEDLPDLSFAGQQDTYLNVIGEQEILKAVINCWSSLWTARAIGYRIRNHIPHEGAALAVVVQEMVPSEVSGVLFTANPLTGLRNETVIDATFGLGEALVSGQVEPDHYVVDVYRNAVVGKTLGAKEQATRARPGGGVEMILENASTRQALTDPQILQLAGQGRSIQREYSFPQDVEWAYVDGRCYILQSRAITSLFPLPEETYDPLLVWFSFGAVQGLVGPITPIGQDAIRHVFAGGARLFDVNLTPEKMYIFAPAGERIWVNITGVIRHPLGRRIVPELLSFIEPGAAESVRSLMNDPRLGAGKGKFKFSTLRRLAKFFLPIIARGVRNAYNPERARVEFDRAIDEYLRTTEITPAQNRFDRLANIIAFVQDRVGTVFNFLLPRFISVFGPSMASLVLLDSLAGEHDQGDHGFSMSVLEVTRGLPQNVTTEMDLALWDAARTIKSDTESREVFVASDAASLAHGYLDSALPPIAQATLTGFMDRYGMRGIGEIDFGQPRWREDPTPVMLTLQSYLQIHEDSAPDVLFARGQRAANAAIEKLAQEARKRPLGWAREKLVRGVARRVRVLMGVRESPKFFAIRVMGIARKALMEVGREFVEAGVVDRAEDLSFLNFSDLAALSRNEARDWKALVAGRRAIYEREDRRRQVPRLLVSDGRAVYEGVGANKDSSDVITGSPVSPGVVEGVVRVILSPHDTHLLPGEILVCPGTDPAWTPLFMAAGGLITEVGGMMTHGSVVAREYGIPAVVGVHQATTRLKDGQRIRVDGTAGKIEILK
jgi:rifampicin phosphotransferase